MSTQFERRVSADPNFLLKSVLEVFLAAATQLFAEINRRGLGRILPEFDFVFAAILTAVIGKYYAMWRVAPTTACANDDVATISTIPTNAFQPSPFPDRPYGTLQRARALIVPAPSLFWAGFAASFCGYGLTSLLARARSVLAPSFVSPTLPVSVWGASLYTGAFVAVVSNLRYQILSGVVEPLIDRCTTAPARGAAVVRSVAVFLARTGNGFLGSVLAIAGMRRLGLQRLK